MDSPSLFFDFVDPLSYLVERELLAADGGVGVEVVRVGLELRPPPAPLARASDPPWAERWATAGHVASTVGAPLGTPSLVPWSRKAHELHCHARAAGRDGEVRAAIFEAFFVRGDDIGRVDVLVTLAQRLGFDRTETKAVLDVDRYEEAVRRDRDSALADGVFSTPTLLWGTRRLEGFHNRVALGTFLAPP